jgi:hypothetical protein
MKCVRRVRLWMEEEGEKRREREAPTTIDFNVSK